MSAFPGGPGTGWIGNNMTVMPKILLAASEALVGFISKRAGDPARAKALLQYLATAEAKTLFKEGGYGLP